ncbi:MAG: LysE family transporter [Anaerolineales bacterium]
MNLKVFLQSLLIGFSIAAPVGPIGILCIRRTLAEGRRAGMISGLGAATADAFYGAIAAFGLTFISSFLINQSIWLRLGGGLFLIYLGFKTFFAKPHDMEAPISSYENNEGMLNFYMSTLFLTISNPLTILSFAAIFAGFGAVSFNSQDYLASAVMVLGIFIGSSTWWFILTYTTGLARNRINSTTLIWINRIAGAIILIFGILALISIQFQPSIS